MDELKLCYVYDKIAQFTDQPLEAVTGDDWDDAPYEHNAGTPYHRDGFQWLSIMFDAPMDVPHEGHYNSPYSIDAINRGDVAWLRPSIWASDEARPIFAGVAFAEFKRLIWLAEGDVYVPVLRDD